MFCLILAAEVDFIVHMCVFKRQNFIWTSTISTILNDNWTRMSLHIISGLETTETLDVMAVQYIRTVRT